MLDRIFDLNKIQNKIIGFSNQTKKEYYDYNRQSCIQLRDAESAGEHLHAH